MRTEDRLSMRRVGRIRALVASTSMDRGVLVPTAIGREFSPSRPQSWQNMPPTRIQGLNSVMYVASAATSERGQVGTPASMSSSLTTATIESSIFASGCDPKPARQTSIVGAVPRESGIYCSRTARTGVTSILNSVFSMRTMELFESSWTTLGPVRHATVACPSRL